MFFQCKKSNFFDQIVICSIQEFAEQANSKNVLNSWHTFDYQISQRSIQEKCKGFNYRLNYTQIIVGLVSSFDQIFHFHEKIFEFVRSFSENISVSKYHKYQNVLESKFRSETFSELLVIQHPWNQLFKAKQGRTKIDTIQLSSNRLSTFLLKKENSLNILNLSRTLPLSKFT